LDRIFQFIHEHGCEQAKDPEEKADQKPIGRVSISLLDRDRGENSERYPIDDEIEPNHDILRNVLRR
jgi:hypothetical protein